MTGSEAVDWLNRSSCTVTSVTSEGTQAQQHLLACSPNVVTHQNMDRTATGDIDLARRPAAQAERDLIALYALHSHMQVQPFT